MTQLSSQSPAAPPTSNPTRLVLIRHAEVEVRYHRVFGGRIDMDLSPLGREQAAALADWMRRKSLDAVYASPMKRVQQTLAPLLVNGIPTPAIVSDLREVDFGDWTGLNWDAIHEKFGYRASQWLHQMENGDVPNGETGAVFRARIEPNIRRIIRDHAGQTVAIVCHGGVICMTLSILTGLPLSTMSLFNIEYASVTQVVLHPHKVELELLNFTPWRDLK